MYEFLKDLFAKGDLSYDKFVEAVNSKGLKIADLSTGNYVSKGKYEDEIKAKEDTIADLNTQISKRDTDLTNIKKQLATDGTDNKTKVSQLSEQLTKLQSDYDSVKTEYESKLSHQSYEFAVKEFANGKTFTSKAAKRDFINELLKENLKMKDDSILGAEDFVKSYSEANSDAFVTETKPDTKPNEDKPPMFTKPVTPGTNPPEANAFSTLFNFSGVRQHDSKDSK